jgi:membrane-bound lytic murein transglycosylase B
MTYAVDYDGDGHRDIWRSTPDALASIANYLKGWGWTGDRSWGQEVRVPADAQAYVAEFIPRRTEGCYAQRNMTERVPMSVWRDIGVTSVDGTPVPAADVVAGLVDVGERKFLVYPNYDAILGYNCAHYYALTAAILAEQIGEPAGDPSARVGAVPPPATKAASQSRPRHTSSRSKSRTTARRRAR